MDRIEKNGVRLRGIREERCLAREEELKIEICGMVQMVDSLCERMSLRRDSITI